MEGIADASMEAVVCTLTLCSVTDMEKTLSEIKRVLKPVSPWGTSVYADKVSRPTPITNGHKCRLKLNKLNTHIFRLKILDHVEKKAVKLLEKFFELGLNRGDVKN